MSEKTFRWGIIGLGGIANAFAEGVGFLPDHKLVAVGSRTLEKAQNFAQKHGAEKAYGSYREVAEDPEIDAIYIATPHPQHKEPALVEKAFTVNEADAQELIDLSVKKNVFLMEAMWMRFNPTFRKVLQLIRDGAIGEPRMLSANFGFRADFNPESRLFAHELGGGALLDVGVYTISLSSFLLGYPVQTLATATFGQTGVDDQVGLLLKTENGAISALTGALRTQTRQDAYIYGTDGQIQIHAPFWCATKFTIRAKNEEKTIDTPILGNGYKFEASEVEACVRAGKIQSDIVTHAHSIKIMRVMDEARRQIGLKYPGE